MSAKQTSGTAFGREVTLSTLRGIVRILALALSTSAFAQFKSSPSAGPGESSRISPRKIMENRTKSAWLGPITASTVRDPNRKAITVARISELRVSLRMSDVFSVTKVQQRNDFKSGADQLKCYCFEEKAGLPLVRADENEPFAVR